MPDLADRNDGSLQSTEPKYIVSSKEESMHVFLFGWDQNKDTLFVCSGINSIITKSLIQHFVSKDLQPNWYCRCSFNLKRYLAHRWTQLERRSNKDTVDMSIAWCVELPGSCLQSLYQEVTFEERPISWSAQVFWEPTRCIQCSRFSSDTSGENQTVLPFVLGTTRFVPMKLMTVPKLEQQFFLLAASLKKEIYHYCR